MFKHLSEEQRDMVIDGLRCKEYEPHIPIISEGEEGNELFIIA
jgi:hypothetical protein